MARQGKALPARTRPVDESLFVRSAESLGRIIGSLQRQLDGASKTFDGARAAAGIDGRGNGHHGAATKRAAKAPRAKSAKTPPKAARVTTTGGANVTGASKSTRRATANRTTTRAAKPAMAGKATSRSRPVGGRKSGRRGRSS